MSLALFQEVMQDYRDEIKDFFAVDKQLASELEYDIKKYNEQLAQEQELAKQADVNRAADSGDSTQAIQVGEARLRLTNCPVCSLLSVFPAFFKIHK
jgi:hypothetical protein